MFFNFDVSSRVRYILVVMLFSISHKKTVTVGGAAICLLLIAQIWWWFFSISDYSDDIACYAIKDNTLPDLNSFDPARSKSIFFHETSCNSHVHGKIVISGREACAVESAARQNPDFQIFLIYSSPGVIKFEGTESDNYLKVLQSYDNVKIVYMDTEEYVTDTLVENLYKEKKIQHSDFVKEHTSDVLRYLTLWKYGGIYLDLDIVVLKSLQNLGFNFAGAESNKLVASGVLGFSHQGVGHVLLTMCLRDLKYNFDGKKWTNNGPDVITTLAKTLCSANDVNNLINVKCTGNFRVLPMNMFYPVPWWNWTKLFEVNSKKEVENMIQDSFAVHLWNKLSSSVKVHKNEEIPFLDIARRHCPKVFQECLEYF